MKIERIESSRHVRDRILIFLEDGSVLRATEAELLRFSLRAGDDLTGETLEALRASAGNSGARAEAAALIGRRAMSRFDLEKKLRDRGAAADEARYAAEWLESIGALCDADYASMLVRHYAQSGYGPARYRQELQRHGIARELWEDAIGAAPEPSEVIERYLAGRFGGGVPDAQELRRAAGVLARRGFSWGDVKPALSHWAQPREE
jgi:regulatory protein